VYIWQVDYPDVPMAVYQLDSVITSLAFSAGDDARCIVIFLKIKFLLFPLSLSNHSIPPTRMLVATTSEGYLHCFQLI